MSFFLTSDLYRTLNVSCSPLFFLLLIVTPSPAAHLYDNCICTSVPLKRQSHKIFWQFFFMNQNSKTRSTRVFSVKPKIKHLINSYVHIFEILKKRSKSIHLTVYPARTVASIPTLSDPC